MWVIILIVYFIIGALIGLHLSVDSYSKTVVWVQGILITIFWLPVVVLSAIIYFCIVVKNGLKRNKMQ